MRSFVVAAVILPLLQLGQPAAAAPQVPQVVPTVLSVVGGVANNVPVVGPVVGGVLGNVAGEISRSRRGVLPDNIGGVATNPDEASETETTATVTSTFTETTVTTTTITETSTSTNGGAETALNAVHIGRRQEVPVGSSVPSSGVVVEPMVLSGNSLAISL